MTECLPTTQTGMTPSQMFAQKMGVILGKACLSSIPFAALVLDIGQAAVDVANAKVIDRFLNELAQRLEAVETSTRERLANDPLHQIASHGVIASLLQESNSRIASILARAVSEIPKQNIPVEQRAELVRIIGRLNEPIMHALQTLHRFWNNSLSVTEKNAIECAKFDESSDKNSQKFGIIMDISMPILNWNGYIDTLMQLGLLESVIGGGGFDDPPYFVTASKLTPLGSQVIAICFETPNMPALGRLAL